MEIYLVKTMERLNSGEQKTILRNIHFLYCHHWSDDKWKKAWQQEEETRKDFNIVLIHQDSGRSLFDPLQDNVVIPSDFFQYIYHVGCVINLHLIINSVLILGGQHLSNRQTVFFLLVDPMDKYHKDPDKIDLEAPRLAQYMHAAWKKRQNTVYWVDINLAQKKGLKFYQTRSNAILLHETLPAYCLPKVVRMETRSRIREGICVTSSSSKIYLKHDWMKELASGIVQRPEGQVVQQSESSQIMMIERRHPLLAVTQVTRKMQEKRPVFRRSKHVLFMKKLLNMIERVKPVDCPQAGVLR